MDAPLQSALERAMHFQSLESRRKDMLLCV